MITLRLYLENISGEWFGWIENMPGCYCRGNSPEEARHAAALAAVDYLAWLRRHGELPSAESSGSYDTDFLVEIAESYSALLDDLQLEPTGFFSCDAQSVDPDELDRLLRLLRHARADLCDAVNALPPNEWETAPLGGKSIRGVLHHVAETEREVLHTLDIFPSEPIHPDPLTALNDLRSLFESQVVARIPHLNATFVSASGERWSLRKALRILLWHERYHTAQIAARSNPRAFLDEIGHAVVVDRRGDSSHRAPERRPDNAETAYASAGRKYYY